MSDQLTQYGFTYGPAEVIRVATWRRSGGEWRVLEVKTPYRTLNVYISPTGRSVRAFERGQELKASTA